MVHPLESTSQAVDHLCGELMREAASIDLTEKLGQGHWSGSSQLRSIRERIGCADPESLRRSTLYVATLEGVVVGSVVVGTFPPGFWKRGQAGDWFQAPDSSRSPG